jgi:hypothetical protein
MLGLWSELEDRVSVACVTTDFGEELLQSLLPSLECRTMRSSAGRARQTTKDRSVVENQAVNPVTEEICVKLKTIELRRRLHRQAVAGALPDELNSLLFPSWGLTE